MPNGNVGAGILNIITESLYDKPIVVFREYVQNSVDSFRKLESTVNEDDLFSKIWFNGDCLFFLDNGYGIKKDNFSNEMKKIALSDKKKSKDIGYKGIGRLSGLPYCSKLIFINICSYKNNFFQKYYIDGNKYNEIKADANYNELEFDDLMELIGTYIEEATGEDLLEIKSLLNPHQELFVKQDTGFLVILERIRPVLKHTMEPGISSSKENFFNELGWLLPVKFKNELLISNKKQLFEDMSMPIDGSMTIPAKAYNISFNGKMIERPISVSMLRDYVCKCDMEYAVGFHSFYRDRIMAREKSEFSGIKLYLDNMLLCDENELLPMLQRYGLINHTANELIQSVKGIGAIIYIIDKVNISANARRTFIEVTDEDSLNFLKYLAEFVNNIFHARYALSRYNSGRSVLNQSQEKLEQLKADANFALQTLARDKITIEFRESHKEFEEFDDIDKKKIIKKKLTNEMNMRIKEYLFQTTTFDYNNVLDDFIIWLSSNRNYK